MGPETRRKRRPALVFSSIAAVAAMAMALAGPATAHHHGDRESDDPAGKIASFDPQTGQLVIDLTEGGQIAGLVTKDTWIDAGSDKCADSDRRGVRARHWCRTDFRRNHHHGHHRGFHHWHSGDTSALVPGATVDDAFLVLRDGKASFAKVDLD